jgi:hypothetical protein
VCLDLGGQSAVGGGREKENERDRVIVGLFSYIRGRVTRSDWATGGLDLINGGLRKWSD